MEFVSPTQDTGLAGHSRRAPSGLNTADMALQIGSATDASSVDVAMALTEKLGRTRTALQQSERQLRAAVESGSLTQAGQRRGRRPPVPDRAGKVHKAKLSKAALKALSGCVKRWHSWVSCNGIRSPRRCHEPLRAAPMCSQLVSLPCAGSTMPWSNSTTSPGRAFVSPATWTCGSSVALRQSAAVGTCALQLMPHRRACRNACSLTGASPRVQLEVRLQVLVRILRGAAVTVTTGLQLALRVVVVVTKKRRLTCSALSVRCHYG